MRKIRRVYMTLALAVLLAGMTACGNNTTNDTGNGNTNTESDMGQTEKRCQYDRDAVKRQCK